MILLNVLYACLIFLLSDYLSLILMNSNAYVSY